MLTLIAAAMPAATIGVTNSTAGVARRGARTVPSPRGLPADQLPSESAALQRKGVKRRGRRHRWQRRDRRAVPPASVAACERTSACRKRVAAIGAAKEVLPNAEELRTARLDAPTARVSGARTQEQWGQESQLEGSRPVGAGRSEGVNVKGWPAERGAPEDGVASGYRHVR